MLQQLSISLKAHLTSTTRPLRMTPSSITCFPPFPTLCPSIIFCISHTDPHVKCRNQPCALFWVLLGFPLNTLSLDISFITFQSVLRCSFLNIYLTAIFLIATISPIPSISFLLIMLYFFLIVSSPINTIQDAIQFTYFVMFIPFYSTQ